MKKIDILVLRTFIPPFITWFMVAVFIFNMQFLWKYIDEIIGKGLDLILVFELLFYQALAMIPHALIFGTALASVMTIGKLAENYELAAMKSAGVSLLRIMRSLIILVIGICITSFLIANFAIPVASLKFKSRLFDIRKQKPTLTLQAGTFNSDFQNYIIYIADKEPESNLLKGVRIYDHSAQMGNMGQTNAKTGEIFFSEDKRYLMFKLSDGERQEERPSKPNKPFAYPFSRITFKSYTTLFDMGEFETQRTDEENFSGHATLMGIKKLLNAIDSMNARSERRVVEIKRNTATFFQGTKPQPVVYTPEQLDSIQRKKEEIKARIADAESMPSEAQDSIHKRTIQALREEEAGFSTVVYVSEPDSIVLKKSYTPRLTTQSSPTAIVDGKFAPINQKSEHFIALQRAISSAKHIQTQASSAVKALKAQEKSHAEFGIEIHKKFSYALACLIFLFIGAPMGAIIKKGGFGVPVLVSFVCFMFFFVLDLVGTRLVKELVIPTWLGAWMTLLVLLPVCILLTYQSMHDTQVTFLNKIGGKIKIIWSKITPYLPKFKKKNAQ